MGSTRKRTRRARSKPGLGLAGGGVVAPRSHPAAWAPATGASRHLLRTGVQGDVDATITALAEQGLQRCQSEDIASEAGTTPATNGAITDLLRDPFLSTDPDQARPAPADLVTAMPWLSNDAEPRAMPTADPFPPLTPIPAPVQSPEPTVSPEANPQAEMQQEPEPTTEEPPLDAIKPTPQPQKPEAAKLLEHSWLRVQLQPEIKSPTDSVEPMGLINRIKGVFARSAGR
ncbi:hypothetical protein Syncc9605_0070 [Synechococcus sp. CC9605]|nr:hypothetical protein Syncc9605_0070 [Synechococcus sp. CC9605]